MKDEINNIQTVRLEPGETPAKKYPAVISGHTVNILPTQSNDNDYIFVVNVYPPSPELGRSIAIDISETFKTRIYQNCSTRT